MFQKCIVVPRKIIYDIEVYDTVTMLYPSYDIPGEPIKANNIHLLEYTGIQGAKIGPVFIFQKTGGSFVAPPCSFVYVNTCCIYLYSVTVNSAAASITQGHSEMVISM